MEKLQIKIPLLLPDVPDEKDSCIQKLISILQQEKGIEKIHISEKKEDGVPQLCFHYNPEVISISQTISLAKLTGAKLTETIGHKLFEVSGIRHTRHARQIEKILQNQEGILEASVTDTGLIRVEYDFGKVKEASILKILEDRKLSLIVSTKLGHEHDHEHEHGGIFGAKSELIFSLIGGLFLGIGFGLSFIDTIPSYVSIILYIISYFFGGFYTTKEAIQTIFKGGFEIDFLMLVAAIGAAILGEWAEGALLLFLFSIGHSLEHYAMGKAQKSIAALADLAPKTALLQKK